jgi:hypothetical protein
MVDEKGIARNWHIDAKALPIRRDSISQIAQIHIEDQISQLSSLNHQLLIDLNAANILAEFAKSSVLSTG